MEFVDTNVLLHAYDTAAGERHRAASELSLARWRVHAPLPDDVIAAASLSNRHQLSFWNAMIVRSAAELHCDTVWTEDLSDGLVIEGITLANPFTRL